MVVTSSGFSPSTDRGPWKTDKRRPSLSRPLRGFRQRRLQHQTYLPGGHHFEMHSVRCWYTSSGEKDRFNSFKTVSLKKTSTVLWVNVVKNKPSTSPWLAYSAATPLAAKRPVHNPHCPVRSQHWGRYQYDGLSGRSC